MWVAILVTMSVTVTGGVGEFKKRWMARAGVPQPWLTTAFQARKGFDLQGLLARFPQATMLRIDGITRKTSHFIKWFFTLYTAQVLMTAEMAANASFGRAVLIWTGCALTFRLNHPISMLFFGSDARVLDGKYGRTNVFTVRSLSILHTLFLNLFAMTYVFPMISEEHQKLGIMFVYLPIAIGDAMGEIVGSAWGKQTIKVWGIGEINRKSKEGTAAVFLGGFIPLLLVVALNGLPPIWIAMAFVVSFCCMVVELITPRGTDALTLPVANMIVTLLFYNTFIAG